MLGRLGPGPDGRLELVSGEAWVVRAAYRLLRHLYRAPLEIAYRRSPQGRASRYVVRVSTGAATRVILRSLGIGRLPPEGDLDRAGHGTDCPWAYLRGIFLARGSVNRPGRAYHLELVCESAAVHRRVGRLLEGTGLRAGTAARRGMLLHYLKGVDQVVAFLQGIGADRAVLELESSRALKGMRNQVNRMVNAETANLEKSVAASLRQAEAIRRLQRSGRLAGLPDPLRAVARARLRHPDLSLRELGLALRPPVPKSTVEYRMNRLMRLAGQLPARGDTH
ncbi:sporulation protein [Limnochorda pilosa]|uniref:Probable cell division protein WhiA n=1 Tax=Limnochorda pilosa TaxID=1555112 RepID=A0A0K2SJ41_LIMPI|nr:sporulation protein [Limnochorda pilosa]